jgi:L-ascorbate metabolism protein UlaG (beta-lactamase superfamily)
MSTLQGTRVTWLGHSTVLVQTAKGTNLLIDPFIAHNPKYPKGYSNFRRKIRLHSAHPRPHGSYGRHCSGGRATWIHGGGHL